MRKGRSCSSPVLTEQTTEQITWSHLAQLSPTGDSWPGSSVRCLKPERPVWTVPAPGVARWSGSAQPLGGGVAHGVREVLLGSDPSGVILSQRGSERLGQLRAEHPWVRPDVTSLVIDGRGRARWWTFAGWRANLWLARAGADLRRDVAAIDDLTVALDPGATLEQLHQVISEATEASIELTPWVTAEAVDGLKFSECLPRSLATEVIARRLADPESTTRVLGERLVGWRDAT